MFSYWNGDVNHACRPYSSYGCRGIANNQRTFLDALDRVRGGALLVEAAVDEGEDNAGYTDSNNSCCQKL